MAPALLEKVAHPACAHADEHLNEVGTGHVEESNVGFSRNGLCQEGLPRSGHADQEDSLRDLRPEAGELLRALEKLHHFLQLVLGFILPRDVREGDPLRPFQVALGPAFAE